MVERGIFDDETPPQELTLVRMGKIVKGRFPELTAEDQEAVRQHAVAALNLTQKAKLTIGGADADETCGSTAFVDGVRKFALSVRELDIDLIDGINPFEAAYAVLAKSMNEPDAEAGGIRYRREAGGHSVPRGARSGPAGGAVQARAWPGAQHLVAGLWERRMAEGVAALARFEAQKRNG